MFWYPVQRQMLPARACLTSASVGSGLSARIWRTIITMPGVQ